MATPLLTFGGATGLMSVPLEDVFDLNHMKAHVRVISMADFLSQFGDSKWAPEHRRIFCFERHQSGARPVPSKACKIEGNPFKTFWSLYGIEFNVDQKYGTSVWSGSPHRDLQSGLSAIDVPVFALKGASQIARFPAESTHLHLQQYLKWSPSRTADMVDFLVKQTNPLVNPAVTSNTDLLELLQPLYPMLAIHLRIGSDFQRACITARGRSKFFSSQQCTLPAGVITDDICMPTKEAVAKQVADVVADYGINSIYIGVDTVLLAGEFQAEIEYRLQSKGVSVAKIILPSQPYSLKFPERDPLMDLQVGINGLVLVGIYIFECILLDVYTCIRIYRQLYKLVFSICSTPSIDA